MTNQEIADAHAITLGTAKWHLSQFLSKLQVTNRMQALVRARQHELL
jgi:DNA-binding NarL/FixJ family response regulator